MSLLPFNLCLNKNDVFFTKCNLYYLVFCVIQIKSSVLGVMTVHCMYDDIVFSEW